MGCNNYFDMTDQGDSFETWQGLRGPAGPQGPAGAPGAPGTSVELRGPVETTGDLPATASSSELWLVGSAAPYHGWFYNGEAWEDAGEIAVGPTGPQGPAGQDGTDGSDGVTFTPTVSSAGVISWTNDGSLPNPDPVDIKGPQGETGAAGSDGSNGATFTPSVSSAGVISWTNDGGLPNPQSVNIKGPQGETGATGPAGPGVPPGGTAGQVLTKTGPADYAAAWQDPSGGDVTADMLGIVIDGNSTPVGASVGQYVIVKNSAITGITDGLYTAAQAIPANTAIDSTYLSTVNGGGLNAVKSDAQWHLLWTNLSPNSAFAAQTIALDLSMYLDIKVEAYGFATSGYFGIVTFGFKGSHHNTIMGYSNNAASGAVGLASREFICNNTGITFSEGYFKIVSDTTAPTVENLRCVPIKIYAK